MEKILRTSNLVLAAFLAMLPCLVQASDLPIE